MNTACQPLPKSVAEELLQGATRALCDRPGDDPARRDGRTREMIYSILGFEPRDGLEYMIAALVYGHYQTILDSMRDVFRGQLDSDKARTKATIVSLDRGVLGFLREMRMIRRRPLALWAEEAQRQAEADETRGRAAARAAAPGRPMPPAESTAPMPAPTSAPMPATPVAAAETPRPAAATPAGPGPAAPKPPAAAPTPPNLAAALRTLAPQTLVPRSLAPQTLAPQTLVPQTLVPQTLAPRSLAPQTLAPQTLAPQTLVPETLAPHDSAPQTAQGRSASPASGAGQTLPLHENRPAAPPAAAPAAVETRAEPPLLTEEDGTIEENMAAFHEAFREMTETLAEIRANDAIRAKAAAAD